MVRVFSRSLYRVGVFDKYGNPAAARFLGGHVHSAEAVYKIWLGGRSTSLRHRAVGTGGIVGTTKIKGAPANTPIARPVVVFDADSMQPVAWTKSTDAGDYRVNGLVVGKPYFVVAFDTAKVYRPAISDVLAV